MACPRQPTLWRRPVLAMSGRLLRTAGFFPMLRKTRRRWLRTKQAGSLAPFVLRAAICKLFPVRYLRAGIIKMPTDPPDWQKRNQDILKEAFRKAQEEQRGKTAEKNVANRVSETIKNHKNNLDFTPKGNLRRSVDRTYNYNKVAVERAKSNEEIRKAQAAAENAKKQAAAKPAPAQRISAKQPGSRKRTSNRQAPPAIKCTTRSTRPRQKLRANSLRLW